MNALQIITDSMRFIGALASGETPTSAEASDSLRMLNLMIDSWSVERLMIFTIQRQVFDMPTAKQTYTLGPGGDFNVPRPPRLVRAGIISLNNVAQPLELPLEMLTVDEWADIPVKNIQSALPLKLWNDNAYPLMNLNFWCIPNQDVNVALYTWTALSQFADFVTDYEFPPAYLEAIEWNLALKLAPQFEKPSTMGLLPQVAAEAISCKARVKTINSPLVDLRVDPAISAKGRHYNWISDSYQ